jgi:hypothetical protein
MTDKATKSDAKKSGVVLRKRGVTHGETHYAHNADIELSESQFNDWEKAGIVGPKATAKAADKKAGEPGTAPVA